MATIEERLTLLEQNMHDINHNETILLGLAMKQGEHLREVRLNLVSLSERVDTFERNVNSRFDAVDSRIDAVDSRVDTFERNVNIRFDAVDSRFDRLEALLTQVIARLPQQPQQP